MRTRYVLTILMQIEFELMIYHFCYSCSQPIIINALIHGSQRTVEFVQFANGKFLLVGNPGTFYCNLGLVRLHFLGFFSFVCRNQNKIFNRCSFSTSKKKKKYRRRRRRSTDDSMSDSDQDDTTPLINPADHSNTHGTFSPPAQPLEEGSSKNQFHVTNLLPFDMN